MRRFTTWTPPEKRHDDFVTFVNETWFPLQVQGNNRKAKTVHHQYNTLNLIFSFAEEQEMIAKNPMRKVEAPKRQKKPVDALTQEQTTQLFKLLPSLPLDFHCILLLLITTGMRRGECMGLQRLLQQYQQEVQKKNPGTILKSALLFPKGGDVFSARDPSAAFWALSITIRPQACTKQRFFKNRLQRVCIGDSMISNLMYF